ncbi:hypothetical protein LA080_012537 [Diaporthe eres]|uniref:Uncharacterized protein n=1 Tax=Diaporthe vaccinii TaxID=105482 RepID=A0ABR4EZ49_9PEZI|nr:hypothetical protein LA080_012537 [Diaporthe eres]
MSSTRLLSIRPLAGAVMRPGQLPIRQAAPSFTSQRANYSPIPPHDKKNDDLGGPYGQEPPNPEHRQKQNRGFAFRAAAAIGLALGVVSLFSVFATPRQIAQHQIENDKVIGAPTSNTGKALADLKRRDGVKTSHQLHQEQTGSSILGTK